VFVTPATAEALASAVGGAGAKQGPEALSHREHQVFRLLTLGHSVSEIGAQLQLAPNTVSTYRARILEKMELRTTAELMRSLNGVRAKLETGWSAVNCRPPKLSSEYSVIRSAAAAEPAAAARRPNSRGFTSVFMVVALWLGE